MMNLDELFCDVDDFCQWFLPAWHRQLLSSGEGKRRRASRLTRSEIMTMLTLVANSNPTYETACKAAKGEQRVFAFG